MSPSDTLKGCKVLVTGADGFIGSHLVEELVTAGVEVTALALYDSFDRHGWLDELEATVLDAVRLKRGDVRDAALMRRLADGQDVVFHLAALISIPYSYDAAQSFVDVNVKGTLNLLEVARSGGIGRLVHTSTSEVYGTAISTPIAEDHPLQGQSPYAASKVGADKMVEAYVRSFDLPAVILRPFNTYGPRQSERAVIPTVIRQALDPTVRKIRVGSLTPKRDFSFVTDTVRAFLAVGAAPGLDYGTAYNSGTGHWVTICDIVEQVKKLTGCNKAVQTEPERQRPDQSEVMELLADSSRLTAATGWRAEISLSDGLERTITWWRERLASGRVRPRADYSF